MAPLSPRQKHGFYNVTFHKGASNLQNSPNKLNGTRAITPTVRRLRYIQHYFYKNNNNQTVNIITTRQVVVMCSSSLTSHTCTSVSASARRHSVLLNPFPGSVSHNALASSAQLNMWKTQAKSVREQRAQENIYV